MILRATVEKDYKIRILGYRVLAIFIAKPITVIAIRNVGDDIGCAGHLQESAKNGGGGCAVAVIVARSEEHTSELQSLMRISSAVFCLKKTNTHTQNNRH